MPGSELWTREVVTAREDAEAHALAEALVLRAVGTVVIVDDEGRPVGIVTDRDLTCRVIAEGRDPEATRARHIMSQPVRTAALDARLEEVIDTMRVAGVRRLPVVNGSGRAVGLVSLDDLVVHLGRELGDLAEAARREIFDARAEARWERRRALAEQALHDLLARLEGRGEEARRFLAEEISELRERLRRLGGD